MRRGGVIVLLLACACAEPQAPRSTPSSAPTAPTAPIASTAATEPTEPRTEPMATPSVESATPTPASTVASPSPSSLSRKEVGPRSAADFGDFSAPCRATIARLRNKSCSTVDQCGVPQLDKACGKHQVRVMCTSDGTKNFCRLSRADTAECF